MDKVHAIIIGEVSRLQYETQVGVDTWPIKMWTRLLLSCQERKPSLFKDHTPDTVKNLAVTLRKDGLLGGIKTGRNNSPKLNAVIYMLDALAKGKSVTYDEAMERV